ncbi:hypothetical protein MJD09_19235 [bacterium]|nr:hypothetical protein [bacterium]
MRTLLRFFVAVMMLVIVGCSGENSVLNSDGDQTNGTEFQVKYEVRFLSQGTVKISYKDNHSNVITADRVGSDWATEYTFRDRVDALLDVEATDVDPTNQVTVQLAIFVNGNRVQQSTSIITYDKKSNISYSRP